MPPEHGVIHRPWVEGLMVRPSSWMYLLQFLSVLVVVDQLVLHVSYVVSLVIKHSLLLVFLVSLILVLGIVDDIVSIEGVVREIYYLFACDDRLYIK